MYIYIYMYIISMLWSSIIATGNPTCDPFPCLRRLVATADTEIQLVGIFKAALREASNEIMKKLRGSTPTSIAVSIVPLIGGR